jgi:3D (Asp-Asp-Asp) domain-containing protein
MPAGRINAGRNNARNIPVEDVEVDSVEGALIDFDATAYCLSGRTASGVGVRPGIIAADPRVLPIGTVVHLRAGTYTGIYTVMDTGGRIKGRIVDVYVPTRKEAMQFGRRQVKIKVIGRNNTKPDRPGRTILASEE